MQVHALNTENFCSEMEFSLGNEKREWYSVAFGNHGITMIQQHSVMIKNKPRMYQLIWSCGDEELLMSPYKAHVEW